MARNGTGGGTAANRHPAAAAGGFVGRVPRSAGDQAAAEVSREEGVSVLEHAVNIADAAALQLAWLELVVKQQAEAEDAAVLKEASRQEEMYRLERQLQRSMEQRKAAEEQLQQHTQACSIPEAARKVELLRKHLVCYKVLKQLALAGWDKRQPGRAAAAGAEGEAGGGMRFVDMQVRT